MIKTTLVCGYEIAAHEKTYIDPAYVRLHKMGDLDSSFFTPDEADRFARAVATGAQLARRTDGKVPDSTEISAAIPVEIRDLLKKLRGLRDSFRPDATTDNVFSLVEKWIDELP